MPLKTERRTVFTALKERGKNHSGICIFTILHKIKLFIEKKRNGSGFFASQRCLEAW